MEPYLGDSSVDDVYGPAVTVRCRWEGRLSLTSEAQRVNDAKLYARLAHDVVLLPDSRVTDARGGVGYVQAVARHEDGGAGGWQHLEVAVR